MNTFLRIKPSCFKNKLTCFNEILTVPKLLIKKGLSIKDFTDYFGTNTSWGLDIDKIQKRPKNNIRLQALKQGNFFFKSSKPQTSEHGAKLATTHSLVTQSTTIEL